MSLAVLADHMASKGRGPDSMLIHMSPREVQGLQALAEHHGGTLTINPETGLPEAGFLDSLLPTILGAGLTFFSGGAINPIMAAGIVGGIQTARTGDLGKGIMAGFGAYGGANLGTSFAGAGEGLIGEQALASEAGRQAVAQNIMENQMTEEAARSAVMKNAVANTDAFGKLSAGFEAATSKGGMDALRAASPVGAPSLGYSAAMAAGPAILADLAIKANMPTTTTRPGAIRTFSYNPYDQLYTPTGNYEVPVKAAGGGLMGMADGGYNPGQLEFTQRSEPVVRMANGGAAPVYNSVEDLYTNILGRAPDAGGLAYWQQGFGDTIDANEIASFKNAAQAELANRTPAEQQALAPNLMGYPSRQFSGVTGDFTPMPVMDSDNPLGSPGNTPFPETGGKFGTSPRTGLLPGQDDGFGLPVMGNPPPYSMGEDGRGLPPSDYQNTPAVQQSMSAVASTAAPTNASVEELYRSILGRAPDAGGLAYWQQQFGDTVDATERATFAQAAKPEQQVADMYRNVLGRDPDPGGLQYWTTRINAGESPSNVYNEFLAIARENTELVTADQIKNATFEQATTPYTGYRSTDQTNVVDEWIRNTLGREPTEADKRQSWYKDAFNAMNTVSEAKNLYNQFIDYAKTDAAATTAQKIKDATASLAARGITEADVLRQTGKTIAQLAASDIDFTKNLVGASQLRAPGTKAGFDFSTIRKPTTPQTNAPVGTTNPYGNATNPGDITRNADGSITVTPNIPGRPYGGFSGMEQVRNAYTDGGGRLGYIPYAPRTMEEFEAKYNTLTGGSKQAYDYLTGKTKYSPVPYTETGEVMKPYSESVLGVPRSLSSKRVLFDPATRTYKNNPDYVPVSYTDKGEKVYGLSSRDIAAQLPDVAKSDYENWMKENNVTLAQIAEALGISLAEAKKRYSGSKTETATTTTVQDDGGGNWANGGLMKLAGGGIGGAVSRLAENASAPTEYKTATDLYRNILGRDPENQEVEARWNATLGDTIDAEDVARFKASAAPELVARTPAHISRLYQNVLNRAPDLGGAAYWGERFGDEVDDDELATFTQAAQDEIAARTPVNTGGGGRNDIVPDLANAVATYYIPELNYLNAATRLLQGNIPGAATSLVSGLTGGISGVVGGIGRAFGFADGGPVEHYQNRGLGGMAQQFNLGGYSDGGRLLRGPGDGVSDSIPATIGNKRPARLADGEFVVPARIVSELGNGSTEAGARKLYAMMDRVQKARQGTVGKGKVAKNSRSEKYLPA